MTLIKLYKAFCPNSTDRIVRMVANLESVMACLENIFGLLENEAVIGTRKDYNPDNFDESNAPNYGGFVSKEARCAPRRIGNAQPNEDFYENEEYITQPNAYLQMSLCQFDDAIQAVVAPVYNPRNALLE